MRYVANLNAGGTAPQPLGPLTQLAVQKGDTVTVVAPGYYPQATSGNSFAFSLASFVANLLAQQPPAPVGTDGRSRPLPLLSIGVSTGLPALSQLGGGVPKGYVRLLVFDADSNLVSSQGQVQQLSSAAHTGYEPLTVQVIVQQDGYVTAYVGNESNTDVYFDDVTVEHRQGLQVQENQYDPWGLSLVGLSYASPGIKSLNQYLFNGKEHQNDLGLGWSDYGARMYDSQLGRWHSVDPLADMARRYSTYSFAFNNPLRYIDPDGMMAEDGTGNDPEKEKLKQRVDSKRAEIHKARKERHEDSKEIIKSARAEISAMKHDFKQGRTNDYMSVHNKYKDDRSFRTHNSLGVSSKTGYQIHLPTTQRMKENTQVSTPMASPPKDGEGADTQSFNVPEGAKDVSLKYNAIEIKDRFTVSKTDTGGELTGTCDPVGGDGTLGPVSLPSTTTSLDVTVDGSPKPESTMWGYQLQFTVPQTINGSQGIKIFYEEK